MSLNFEEIKIRLKEKRAALESDNVIEIEIKKPLVTSRGLKDILNRYSVEKLNDNKVEKVAFASEQDVVIAKLDKLQRAVVINSNYDNNKVAKKLNISTSDADNLIMGMIFETK